jgi:hypothetical protein
MSDENNPEPGNKDPIVAIMWLLVGLVPIVILLAIVSSPSPHTSFGVVLIGCAVCNVLGGFGCLRGVKNTGAWIVLGLFLSGFLFVLSWGIAFLQAC